MADTVRAAPREAWRLVASHPSQFVEYLARFVSAKCLCGYTKEELASPGDQHMNILSVVTASMELLEACLQRLSDMSNSAADGVLDVLEDDFPRLWSDLWDVREPLLTSHIANARIGTCDHGDSCLHGTPLGALAMLAMAVVEALQAQDISTEPTTSRIPHLLLFIWIYATDHALCLYAARSAKEILLGDSKSWGCFHRNFTRGCTDRARVVDAFLRDWHDRRTRDGDLYDSMMLAVIFFCRMDRTYGTVLAPQTPAERELIPAALAAARRQTCSPGCTDCAHPVIRPLCLLLQPAFETDEEVTHFTTEDLCGIIGLVAKNLVFIIEDETRAKPDNLLNIVDGCRTLLLEKYDSADSKALALRHRTYEAWSNSLRVLGNPATMPAMDPDWDDFLDMWKYELGADLQPDDALRAQHPVAADRRHCNWSGCLCSAHEPPHRVKVCKGCWSVVYCGKDCQENDWTKGGHRERCLRTKAPSADTS
ncbi:hypothetical protein PsYK624_012330 [Phanerochaete sordida]|uniref:MYND-type domain-containing protein n=1 Tax=Phanerochaete sordida TaxID=48140 RepID=A0A9P3FZT7_9APHY|nr:hypothetical protein PsYK624_012330 [Phanerochaete sordida]